MISVNDFIKITPKSKWASEVVDKYGHTNKVGKIGSESIMIVNPECVDVNSDNNFHWGFWVYFKEVELEKVFNIHSVEFLRQI